MHTLITNYNLVVDNIRPSLHMRGSVCRGTTHTRTPARPRAGLRARGCARAHDASCMRGQWPMTA